LALSGSIVYCFPLTVAFNIAAKLTVINYELSVMRKI